MIGGMGRSDPQLCGSSLPGTVQPDFVEALEAWFRSEARDLPWRRTRDAYAVWVSEAMLQQTRVEAVRDYWVRFLERFPTVQDLADAEEEAVLEAWSGLGYYRRARSLQAAAKVIAAEHNGVFPKTRAGALALPGVGPYTAGAVLSIAYGQPEPLVDGNVERVFARYFQIEEAVASAPLKARAWAYAEGLIDMAAQPRDWNQSLMELGATICTPRAPRCLLCPVQRSCASGQSVDPSRLPLPRKRKPPTSVQVQMVVARAGNRILLEQRPAEGRMASLWQLPTIELSVGGDSSHLFPLHWAADLQLDVGARLGEFSHSITRYSIRVALSESDLLSAPSLVPNGPYRWFATEQAASLAITGMTKKAIRMLANHES